MGYCAGEGIAPAAVGNDTLAGYLRHRAESRGGPNLRGDIAQVARQWNKMRDTVPGWPEATLALGRPEGRAEALPLTTYPDSLQAEIEDYLAWLNRDPEEALAEADEARAPASPETVASRRKGLRLLLWGAVETGRAPESLTSLGDLVAIEAARDTLRWHRARLGKPNPRHPSQTLPTAGTALLADTLRSLAVYCRVPAEPQARLRRMFALYRPKPQREITEDLAGLLDRLADPGRVLEAMP